LKNWGDGERWKLRNRKIRGKESFGGAKIQQAGNWGKSADGKIENLRNDGFWVFIVLRELIFPEYVFSEKLGLGAKKKY
jgi:hypothetical protein